MAAKKKEHETEAAKPATGGWEPVFNDDAEMWGFLKDFRKAVAEDIRDLAAARRRAEEALMRNFRP